MSWRSCRQGRGVFSSLVLCPPCKPLYSGLSLQIAFIPFFPHKEKEKNVTSEWASFAWWLMVSQNPRILALSLVQRMNVNNFSPVVSQGIYILLLQSIKNWVTFPHKFQRSQHSKSWKGLFWQMTHHKNERKRLNLELGCNWRYLPLLQAKITSICTILAINTAMNVAIST